MSKVSIVFQEGNMTHSIATHTKQIIPPKENHSKPQKNFWARWLGQSVYFLLLVTTSLSFTAMAMAQGPASESPNITWSQTSANHRPEVIYGADDRRERYQVNDSQLQELFAGTVALVKWNSITNLPGSRYQLHGDEYGSTYGLCSSEPYYAQPTTAFCTGFLVTPNLVATAGHCIGSQYDCQKTALVFDFAMSGPNQVEDTLEDYQVYSCVEVIHSEVANSGADFSLVRLDRPAFGHAPLKMSRQKELAEGEGVFVIGHPAGLPAKWAGGANVREVNTEFYTANLDTYGGNSGSPIFNSLTHEVEGILVRGENDFVVRNGCRVSNVCNNKACRGEDFTKIRHITELIQ